MPRPELRSLDFNALTLVREFEKETDVYATPLADG